MKSLNKHIGNIFFDKHMKSIFIYLFIKNNIL